MATMHYKKIAIIKLSAMGDIIHCLIALQFIKQKYPELLIDWFVEESFAQILEYNPHINQIYKINLKSIKRDKKQILTQIRLIKEYSKNRYDLVVDAQGLLKSAIVSRLLSKNVAGFSKTSIREKLASIFYNIKIDIDYKENAIVRACEVISKALKFEITRDEILEKESFLYFKEEKSFDTFLLKNKKNILLVVGASWESKIYPKEKFVKVANGLENENILTLWGSENEKSMAQYISQNSNALLLPRLSLNDLKELVSKVDLVIGNDTGPTHMAWASNTSSITLFGNTPAYRNAYETSKNVTISSNSEVNPCKLDKNDFSISEIKPDDIIKKVRELLYV